MHFLHNHKRKLQTILSVPALPSAWLLHFPHHHTMFRQSEPGRHKLRTAEESSHPVVQHSSSGIPEYAPVPVHVLQFPSSHKDIQEVPVPAGYFHGTKPPVHRCCWSRGLPNVLFLPHQQYNHISVHIAPASDDPRVFDTRRRSPNQQQYVQHEVFRKGFSE